MQKRVAYGHGCHATCLVSKVMDDCVYHATFLLYLHSLVTVVAALKKCRECHLPRIVLPMMIRLQASGMVLFHDHITIVMLRASFRPFSNSFALA
jgi:hypothetical protein